LKPLAMTLLVGLSARPGGATTLLHQDTRALVRGSSDIVVGKVVSTRARLDEHGRHIVTDVAIEVTQSLKGETQRLTLVQLGGELYGMRYDVPGSPRFVPGEEALVFAWRDRRGRAQVNGMAQGKFEIRRDAVTGERTIQRSLPGLAVGDLRTLRALRTGEAAPALPLRRMLGDIQRILEEAGR
jgi:hypothetical protein